VTLGERIKEARQQRGLTQEQLARRSGLTLNAYGDIERGRITDPHYSSLRGIARGLGITVAELVEESAPKAEAPSSSEAGAKPGPTTVHLGPQELRGDTPAVDVELKAHVIDFIRKTVSPALSDEEALEEARRRLGAA
jgi:transcriptional regulator with XRE-family HTH domain